MLQLVIQLRDEGREQLFDIEGDRVTIGRHQENSLRIRNDYLSAYHAEIVRDDEGSYRIIDLGSFNGTFINGLRITESAIRAGDEIKLGFLAGHLIAPDGATGSASSAAQNSPKFGNSPQPTVIALDKRGTRSGTPEPLKTAARAFQPMPNGAVNPPVVAPLPVALKSSTPGSQLPLAAAPLGENEAQQATALRQRVADLEKDNSRLAARADRADEIAKHADELREQLTAEQARLTKLEEQRRDLQAKNQQLSERNRATDIEIAALREEKDNKIEKLRSQLADFEQQQKQSAGADKAEQNRRGQLENALTKTEAALATANQAEQELRGEVKTLTAKLGDSEKTANQNIALVETLRHEVTSLESSIEDVAAAEQYIADVRRKADTISGDIESQCTELKRARRALEDFQTTANTVRADLEAEHNTLRSGIQSTREQLDALTAEHDKADRKERQRIDNLRDEADQIEHQLKGRRSQLAILDAESGDLQARVKRAERALEDLSAQREKHIADATNAGRNIEKLQAKLLRRAKLLDQLKSVRRRERAVGRQEKQLAGAASPNALLESLNSAAAAESRLKQLEKSTAEAEKSHAKLVKKSGSALLDAERKLDKKLQELRLADDRIRYSEQLDRETRARKRELADISSQFEAATAAVRHLQEERVNLATIIEQMERELDARDHGEVTLPGRSAELGTTGSKRSDHAAHAHHQSGSPGSSGSGSADGPVGNIDASDHVTARTEARLRVLKQQIAESESYLRIIRESLRLDDATVRVLTQQVIKRIDLIDDLIAGYRHKDAGDVVEQLDLLRETFLDLLREHSVEPYTFAPGTQLSLARRRRIKIVESRTESSAGNDVPRILETLRPGYLCASHNPDQTDDLILRKAEVITANS